MRKYKLTWLLIIGTLSATIILGLSAAFISTRSLRPLPASLACIREGPGEEPRYANILDRHGYLLSLTRKNRLNYETTLHLWEMPEFLPRAFVIAEDRRFYSHHGVDWLARFKALVDNLAAGKVVRGASTITEQCIRILHPRPRTFASRWLETLEAYQLEAKFSKGEILEFYLNQVPFAQRCRGVAQAADLYFDRTVDTLDTQEMLALAIMVRAPGFFNPYRHDPQDRYDPQERHDPQDRHNPQTRHNPQDRYDQQDRHDPQASARDSKTTEGKVAGAAELHKRILTLAAEMKKRGMVSERELMGLARPLELQQAAIRTEAPHFIRFLKREFPDQLRSHSRMKTTIDSHLQAVFDQMLKESLRQLKGKRINHAALLVLDHQTDEVLAWVNGSDFSSSERGSQIDTVLSLRQPGSTLKPFLYALALDHGYTASTVIPDIPLVQPVGNGLHAYKNYSSTCYGPVRLRNALGNSLNIPAVRCVKELGVDRFLDTLRSAGMRNLRENAAHYGEGLALGNGEVSLFELVRAYSVLARMGIYREPRFFFDYNPGQGEKRIFSPEGCSLIANILSDPSARTLEFGRSGVLEFPVQTAVKTGTSTDYRDSWAIGFNYRYTAGVWMGNLDYTPTSEMTGSRGPAFILRAVFHELNKNQETRPLFFSRTLIPLPVCALSGMAASPYCPQTITEWFKESSIPQKICDWHRKQGEVTVTRLPVIYDHREEGRGTRGTRGSNREADMNLLSGLADSLSNGSPDASPNALPDTAIRINCAVRMVQPVENLHLALDPRIPDSLERFPLVVEADQAIDRITWLLNDQTLATTGPGIRQYLWRPSRGRWAACARVRLKGGQREYQTERIIFWVK